MFETRRKIVPLFNLWIKPDKISASDNRDKKAVKLKRYAGISALCIGVALCLLAPLEMAAQEPEQTASRSIWSEVKQGKISADIRYRFETFQRDGAPYTGAADASTLRVGLGYQTLTYHGFSAFAQGDATFVIGPADYSVPTLPSMNRPNRPAILDPRSMELSQGYVSWTAGPPNKKVAVIVGRQEITLNDGRFVGAAYWRQIHGAFDAARLDVGLPRHVFFTYAFLNRFYRVVGHDATDGMPPMHTHLLNLTWNKTSRINVALYSVLLDYRALAQYALSTETFGLRAEGPYKLSHDWSVLYAADFAKQKNFGNNPYHVDVNYYLGELGPAWRGIGVKAGYALLGGRSLTDKLSTPLTRPFNGWTDLFADNPSADGGHGLEARYLTVSGTINRLGGVVPALIYYDYHSDIRHVHYGSELDMTMAYKVRKISDRWEFGWRFGRYWSDRLFTPALRTSIYTSFSL